MRESDQRKNLGIEGTMILPNSKFFLVPGSIHSKWKEIIHGDPVVDDYETEIIKDEFGAEEETLRVRNVLCKKTDSQEIKIKCKKDFDWFNEEVKKDETSNYTGGQSTLYIGEDGKIYDKSNDVWVETYKHKRVRDVGGIFVNDTYMKLWKRDSGLLLLDGSYGSGKTTYAITRMLVLCMETKFFNGFYGMQELERASQLHRNFIEEIERNGWESEFTYSKTDKGTKTITHNKTGHILQRFGCDSEETIKGWNNPTHVLVDEINHISLDSFSMIMRGLRRPGVKTLFIGCFNAIDVKAIDSDENGSWLWRYFYKEGGLGDKDAEFLRKTFKSLGVIKHHTDYLDNYCQNHHAYWNKLVMRAMKDSSRSKLGLLELASKIATGEWGTQMDAQLYYNRFNPEKHVYPESEVKYHPGRPLIFGFDENTQPYQPCLVAQVHEDLKEVWFVDEFLGYNPINNIPGLCPVILKKYGGTWYDEESGESGKGLDHRAEVMLCFDATSKKEIASLEKGQNYFTITQNCLKELKPVIRVQDANPNNKTRGEFVNLLFYKEIFGWKLKISSSCKKFIEDLQNTMQDIKSEKKSGHKDKSTRLVGGVRQVQPYGHLCDTMDYILCEMLMTEYLMYQNGDMTTDVIGGQRQVRNTYDNELGKSGKRNHKFRGKWDYGELEDNSSSEKENDESEYIERNNFSKRRSKNSW